MICYDCLLKPAEVDMFPRLLHIYGPLWIQMYGVMIAIGFLVFIWLTLKHPLRKKLISQEIYLNTLFIGLLSGIVGGRVLYVLANPYEFYDNWLEIIYPWTPGFVVLGSIIGVLIVIPVYLHWHKIPVLPFFDLAALYAPIMQAIGRLGCLCAGCCYGASDPTLWWAITFSNPAGHAPLHTPLHPTQIYTGIASLIIFFILHRKAQQFLSKPGSLLCFFLILENISRFAIDFWRGDRQPIIASWFDGALTISQVQSFSLVGLALALVGFVWIRYKK
jgi:phosphatidylglycerol---prolipoprotein diacylglyceryl transferase